MTNATLPTNVLTEDDIKLLEDAGQLVLEGVELKHEPSKLRIKLADIAAARFEIGRRKVMYNAYSRDAMSAKYNFLKANMSNNAAYKEAEMHPDVIKYKNTHGMFETAYEVMENFVSIGQTNLRLAAEEAKNTL